MPNTILDEISFLLITHVFTVWGALLQAYFEPHPSLPLHLSNYNESRIKLHYYIHILICTITINLFLAFSQLDEYDDIVFFSSKHSSLLTRTFCSFFEMLIKPLQIPPYSYRYIIKVEVCLLFNKFHWVLNTSSLIPLLYFQIRTQ